MALPVISIAQMREWEEKTWASGQSQKAVIEKAGQAAARHACRWSNPGDAFLVLAGKGHNGDDARAAAGCLPDRQVTLINVSAAEETLAPVRSWLQTSAPGRRWILDGLFGIGLSRSLEGAWWELVNLLNQADCPVLAVDVPSGLDADSGEPMGAAIKAAVTVTFGAPKKGLLSAAAAKYVGRLEVAADIGLVPCPFTSELCWITSEDFQNYPPRRSDDGHKGSFGHLCILAGSRGYHGAAVLAALGAQRAQPGLITLVVPEDIYIPVASQLRSTMVRPWTPDFRDREKFSGFLFGPGLAASDLPPGMKRQCLEIWREGGEPVVADASALDWLPGAGASNQAARVITPHPGEAARLLACTVAEALEDRVSTLRRLSTSLGNCWVVLKGRHTLIGRGAGEIAINSSGNPRLAQGGAGDLLAGFLAGLLAQPAHQRNPGLALRYAVWRHGAAADALSRAADGWTLDDLAAQIGRNSWHGG